MRRPVILRQRLATGVTNGKCFQRAGIGPEASGENNDVEFEFVLGSTQAGSW